MVKLRLIWIASNKLLTENIGSNTVCEVDHCLMA